MLASMIQLVRHGETALNAARVVQPEDTLLNAQGLRQAERVAARLAELSVAQLLSSDLPRARMTADAIGRATGAVVEQTSLLQERNFGALRGRPYAEIGRDIFAPDYVPPDGEAWIEFDARVARAWARVVELAATLSGNLAVVTHGLVCRSIAEQFLALPPGQSVPLRWGNTSLTLCDPAPPHAVHLLNSTAHLELGDGSDDQAAPSGM
jgi:broad specificity phosphatase PhoE